MIREVVKAHLGVDQIGVGGQLGDGCFLFVVLVPDLADQLLQNVLHRDDAAGAAVFVDHDGHVRLGLLELFEQLADGLHLQRVDRREQDLAQGLIRDAAADVEVLLVDGAEDVVDGILIDEKPRIFRLGEQRGDLFLRRGDGEGGEVGAVDQDILRALLGEVDGVFEQLALAFIDAAVLLHLVDEHEQLLLRHFIVGAEAEDLRQQLFPEGEDGVERREDPDEDLQDRRGEHGPGLRAVLGDAFGRDLTEDQHHDGDDHGGDRRADVAIVLDKEHGADGGCGDIHDVVADQDGGK